MPRLRVKRADTTADAVECLRDGDTVFIGGFGRAGVPNGLIAAVCARQLRSLTVVNNNSGYGHEGVAQLIEAGCVSRVVCSFPRSNEAFIFAEAFRAGRIDLEVVPQGTLAERIRAAGAGIEGFLTRTGVGTELADGKRVVEVRGEEFLFEPALCADVALVCAHAVDPAGNAIYHRAARNFNPIMARAASVTIVEAAREAPLGGLDPDHIVTPGIYVDRYAIVS